MPLPALAVGAAKVATTLGPLLGGLLRKKKKFPSLQDAINEYRSRKAKFRVGEEDVAAAGRTRGKIAASAQVSGERARMNAKRQAAARGLSGAAAAALESEGDALAATGRETGALAEAEQLYAAGNRNMEMDQAMEDRIFGSKVGQAQFDARREDQRDVTFWNSMMDLTGAAGALWGNPAAAGAGAVPPVDVMQQSPTWAEDMAPPDAPPGTITDIPGK